MEYPGKFRRFIAYIVDLLIVSVLITRPLNNLINKEFNLQSFFDYSFLSTVFLVNLLMGVLTVLYWSILEYKIGQTIGALLFSLRAKSENNKGLSFKQSLLRNITKINGLLIFIDAIGILFNKKRQRFFERISKTVTIGVK